MAEGLLAALLFAALASVVVLRAALGWPTFLAAAAALACAGLLLSAVGGLGYHWTLRACLRPRGFLPPGWWWQPTALHKHLTGDERARVMPWFVLGAAGFCAVSFACAAALFAVSQL